jgi:hypothetical protein
MRRQPARLRGRRHSARTLGRARRAPRRGVRAGAAPRVGCCAVIPLFQRADERPAPAWISFSIDGARGYVDTGAVIDTRTKTVVGHFATSGKLIEIDFENGIPVRASHR